MYFNSSYIKKKLFIIFIIIYFYFYLCILIIRSTVRALHRSINDWEA